VCIYSILILTGLSFKNNTDRTDQSEGLQTQWKIRKLNSVDLHHTNPTPHVFLIYKHFTLWTLYVLYIYIYTYIYGSSKCCPRRTTCCLPLHLHFFPAAPEVPVDTLQEATCVEVQKPSERIKRWTEWRAAVVSNFTWMTHMLSKDSRQNNPKPTK